MKKIPQRMCVICRERKNKSDLIRIVRNNQNEVKIDKNGKEQGRGAYICKDKSCLEKLKKSNILVNMLEITIPEIIYQDLEKIILGGEI